MHRSAGYTVCMSTAGVSEGRFVVPEIVSSHFHLRKGDAVADFGAGTGYFIPHLSRMVGTDGRVFACEIQKNLVETITALVREKRLSNVEVLWCDFETSGGMKLRDSSIDVGVLVNTLFQIEQKDAAFEEFARTIRSGGKLFVIDWTSSFAGLGPPASHVVTADDVKGLAESHRFVFERSFDAGHHHYGLAFRKL